MAIFKCKNCSRVQERAGFCSFCGDNVQLFESSEPVVETKVELETIVDERDLNKDGVVDKKDKSLAGKILSSKHKKKK